MSIGGIGVGVKYYKIMDKDFLDWLSKQKYISLTNIKLIFTWSELMWHEEHTRKHTWVLQRTKL
jgi:hypothetical protein